MFLERVEIAERNVLETREQRPEALREMRVSAGRQRAEREPVESVFSRDDAGAAGCAAAEFDRRLVRFGAGIREQDARESFRRAA